MKMCLRGLKTGRESYHKANKRGDEQARQALSLRTFINSAIVEKHYAFQSWLQTSDFFFLHWDPGKNRGKTRGRTSWLSPRSHEMGSSVFGATRDPRSLPALSQYTVDVEFEWYSMMLSHTASHGFPIFISARLSTHTVIQGGKVLVPFLAT
jgi:hypothetical protein